MRALSCALLLAVPVFLPAQEENEEWQRVYTGEDSIIEIDVSRVTFVQYHVSKRVLFASTRVGRVQFRTILAKPEALEEKPSVRYKTQVETIEFNCAANQYRLYEASLLDDKGKVVTSYRRDQSEDWKELKFGSMMDKLSKSACSLIDEKRRNP